MRRSSLILLTFLPVLAILSVFQNQPSAQAGPLPVNLPDNLPVETAPLPNRSTVTITYAQAVTFTAMNYYESGLYEADPNNATHPQPVTKTSTASNNTAKVSIAPGPDQAGIAKARVGLAYDLSPGDKNWFDIVGEPVDVTVIFEYTLEANWMHTGGSGNAGLGLSLFVSPWYAFYGHTNGQTGTETERITVTYQTDFNNLDGKRLIFETYAQAHSTGATTLSSSKSEVKVISIAFQFAPEKPDLSANNLEITQANQDLNQSTRLVAGKPTFVRVHVDSSKNNYLSFARLRVSKDGTTHTIYPGNPGSQIAVRENPSRGQLNHAFLFEIPRYLAYGSVDITADLNPETSWRGRSPVESSYENNSVGPVRVTFETVPTLDLVIYKVVYTHNGAQQVPPNTDVQQLVRYLKKVFPVGKITYQVRNLDMGSTVFIERVEGGKTKKILTNPTCTAVNQRMLAQRAHDLKAKLVTEKTLYYGIALDTVFMRGCSAGIPSITASGPTGKSGSWFPWDTDGTYGDWYGAHELSHALGRRHVLGFDTTPPPGGCGDERGADGGYPFQTGYISTDTSGANAFYGFDIFTRQVYGPRWVDYMTYCPRQWISEYTYENNLDTFTTRAAQDANGTTGDYFLVTGWIDPVSGEGQINPAFLLEDLPTPPPPTPGENALVLIDGDGKMLSEHIFSPTSNEHGPALPTSSLDYESPDPGELLLINELVAYIPGTAFINLDGLDSPIDILMPGLASPVVTVTAPNTALTLDTGLYTVTWEASDPDGDALAFNVQYSYDSGATWLTIVQIMSGTAVVVDIGSLGGAGTSSLFKVTASDGVHNASDTSDVLFTVPNRVPAASIIQPEGAVTIPVSATLALEAQAYDIELGSGDALSLTWTSSLDGSLGEGGYLSLESLSPGVHTIMLTASDGAGGTVTDTVQVTIVSNPTLLPEVPDALEAGPEAVLLNAESISATVLVDNQHPTRTLTWNAATTDTWFTLDTNSGTTPGSLTITLNDALTGTFYAGNVELTSPTVPGKLTTIIVQAVLDASETGETTYTLFLPLLDAPPINRKDNRE